MKTILVSTLAAAGLALSLSTAFAASNSPQGNVVTDTSAHSAPAHFLSGNAQVDENAGLSSNAIDGRTRQAVQQDRY